MSGEGDATPEIQFWRSGEWTGVYVDGNLVRSGDHYLADEWLQARYGVKVIDSDDWIPDGRNPLADLDAVEAETARRERLRAVAQEKRDQAASLLAEAVRLEGKITRTHS